MSNSVVILNEQVLEMVSGGRGYVLPTITYAPNNSKTNNSTIVLSNFGMNAFGNLAASGGAIGNISISVLQANA